MSDWCVTHTAYSAKRPPTSVCARCWTLFFLKNPEDWRNNPHFKTELSIVRKVVE